MHSPSLKLYESKPHHAKRLTKIAFASKAHWGYDENFMAQCKEELSISGAQISDKNWYYAHCCKDKTIIGFAALENTQNSRSEFELDALFVLPGYMGHGAGRKLLSHLLQIAWERGAQKVIVQSDPNADIFYEKMGGRRCGERASVSIANRSLSLFSFSIA